MKLFRNIITDLAFAAILVLDIYLLVAIYERWMATKRPPEYAMIVAVIGVRG